MSGHSHWRTIKRAKQAKDEQRGKIFSKMARMISVATREGGSNPETNSKLRLAIEMARSVNIPKENIERAIKKGTGELKGVVLEEVVYEAYGPGKVAIIIEGITDNKNRAKNEISQILNQHNGKLADPGSVKWMFDRKGVITISITNRVSLNKEKIALTAIEVGAEDIYQHQDSLDVYTKIEDLGQIKKRLEKRGIKIESATLDWVAKEELEIEEKDKIACQKLFEALDENEAVQEIYSNIKLP